MPRAILNCGPDSSYDDRLPDKYHFKNKLRSSIQKCVGHDVIIYGPAHTGGPQAYVASARLSHYEADNDKGPGNFKAILVDFQPFRKFVPHIINGKYVEESAVSKNGRFAPLRSVRFPSNEDFDRILVLAGGF